MHVNNTKEMTAEPIKKATDDLVWTEKGVEVTKAFATQLGNQKAGDAVTDEQKAMIKEFGKWDILVAAKAFKQKGAKKDDDVVTISTDTKKQVSTAAIKDVKEHTDGKAHKSAAWSLQVSAVFLLPLVWLSH